MTADFDDFFTGAQLFGSGNVGRWLELMHKYQVARFVNLQGSQDPGETLLQWLPAEMVGGVNVNSPQYRYGLFTHKNLDWYKKIHVYPLYMDPTEALGRLAGVYGGCDIWPEEFGFNECVNPPSHWPTWAYYAHGFKQAEVSTYAANYLVFRAPATDSGTLRLRLGIAEEYGCIVGAEGAPYGSSVVWENTGDLAGQGLYYTLLGYRDLTAVPHPETQPLTEINSASQIDVLAEGYLENLNIGSSIEVLAEDFGLPGEGGTYAACALVLSAAENALPTGGEDEVGRIIPYWLEYDVVPQVSFTPSHITSDAEWGPDATIWVQEDIVIDPDVTLTIWENTRVWFAGTADSIIVRGGLDVQGQASEPVNLSPTTLLGGAGVLKALTVGTGATCSMTEVQAENLGRFDLAANVDGFTLSTCDLCFADADELAGLQSNPNQDAEISLAGCSLWNAVTLELAGASVTQCDLHQRLAGLGDHPLVVVDRGETTIADSYIEFLNQGLDTAPQSSKDGYTAELLLDGVTLEGVDAENSTGLNLQLNSRAEVQGCLMRVGLATAIEANSGSWLRLRGSRVQATAVCILAGRGSAVDLGVLLPPPDGSPPYEFDIDDPGNNLIYNTGENPDCELTPACCPFGGGQVCEETIPIESPAIRVSNRTRQQIWALGNFWGACLCEEEYFEGSAVAYADSVWVPPGSSGCHCPGLGGGLSVIAGETAGSGPSDYRLLSGPVFSKECVIARAPGSWARSVQQVVVYDIGGRAVRRLAVNATDGQRAIIWDGRDDAGRATATGVYFIRITEGARRVHFKVIKLR